MPHTSLSRSISLRASPNSHFRASSLSCVTYTLTDSPCCLTLLWNLYRWTITGGLGLKCSAINFISSSYVLPPGVSGATRLASVWYAFGPMVERRTERFLLASLTPLAPKKCPSLSTYCDQSSSPSTYSPTAPKSAMNTLVASYVVTRLKYQF